jgi:hypothetical protein
MAQSHGEGLPNEAGNGRHAGGDFAPAERLALAAAPSFATMALFTLVCGDAAPTLICMAAPGHAPANGMVVMYLLMSVFHAPPWLKLLSAWRRRRRAARAVPGPEAGGA